MDKRPIGVFDSGMGGLTCVKEVMKVMPGENVIYFGDTGRLPYGSRGADTIVKYVRQDIRFLRTFDIKMIIIACGTASSAALPWLADELDTDVLGGVEPAVKRAAAATKNGRIGVLGTAGTVRSGKYVEYIKNIDSGISVFQKACPMFVPLVENGYSSSEVTRIIAKEYLDEVKAAGVDTLILGCTHYPLLKNVIRGIMGDGVTLIDSGAAAADYAYEKLRGADMLSGEKSGTVKYFVSDTVDGFEQLGGMFLEQPISGSVERIDIEKY